MTLLKGGANGKARTEDGAVLRPNKDPALAQKVNCNNLTRTDHTPQACKART